MMKQAQLFPLVKNSNHGGVTRKGKRKTARPIATKRPMHIVLRSTRAKGTYSFLRPVNAKRIADLLKDAQKRFHVKVYERANSGNHLHLCLRAQTRSGFKNFLRYLTSQIAQVITGAKKGKPFGKFWDELAFSRIVAWGKDFQGVLAYVRQNTLEAMGLIPYVRPVRDGRSIPAFRLFAVREPLSKFNCFNELYKG